MNPKTHEIKQHDLLSATHYDVLTDDGNLVEYRLRHKRKTNDTYISSNSTNPEIQENTIPSPYEEECQPLTTNQGEVIIDNDHSLKVGLRGPTLLEDHILREKLMSFDHERIPERVVHARGSGAYGMFTSYGKLIPLRKDTCSVYNHIDISNHTTANFSQGQKDTPTFVRFSQVVGSKGSADTVRDVRGFATKFYTNYGNYDLVGNNIPVFFIFDGIKFPDLAHAIKPEPDNGIPQASAAHNNFWDFISLTPEAMNMILWLLSDIGVMRSYRHMEGAGVNTFSLINQEGSIHLVKFHWKPHLGIETLSFKEAQRLAGEDPDYLRRDLWEAIRRHEYPRWDLCIQLIPFDEQEEYEFDPLDPTKVWDEERFPLFSIGEMVLDRNPSNFFAEVEQVAFHPGHIVPGIGLSNDPLLHARLFSYLDTQITRVGPNFAELPINSPIVEVRNNQRQGKARLKIHRGSVNYDPNTRAGGCPMSVTRSTNNSNPSEKPTREETSTYEQGYKIRGRPEKWNDYFSQPRKKYELMTPQQKDHLVSAFHYELGHVDEIYIRVNMLRLIDKISPELAKRVSDGLVLNE